MLVRRSAQITGALFVLLGIVGILTSDVLLGGVWALLGVSMLLSNPFRAQQLARRSPRSIGATLALVAALVLLILDFV